MAADLFFIGNVFLLARALLESNTVFAFHPIHEQEVQGT
tara:strand:- start:527 stop:643 length:117 start_codon:yes stop_codon:yes gene_type:complete